MAACRLAEMEGVNGHNLLLLLTGAYFHDIGFVEQAQDHETASIRIASAVLPGCGYSPQDVAVVEGLIEVTRIPQRPHTQLETILADADLDCLGREDFWVRSRALYDETIALNGNFKDNDWCEIQLNFLGAHRYFTPSAVALRGKRKERHLEELAMRWRGGLACC
ncbi:MAG: phosphohydrolase [Chloroflexota bacterium]